MRGAARAAVAAEPVTLYLGGIYASGQPTVVKTLLGSCIAVCLWDPATRVGGMNHFMLPRGDEATGNAARFGVHAMDQLITATMKAGGDRRRLVAKVFGAAHVLDVQTRGVGVPGQNIDFIRRFLEDEGMPLLSADVGGHSARQVHFHTETGRVFVKRLVGDSAQARLLDEEARWTLRPPAYGDVTLFE